MNIKSGLIFWVLSMIPAVGISVALNLSDAASLLVGFCFGAAGFSLGASFND